MDETIAPCNRNHPPGVGGACIDRTEHYLNMPSGHSYVLEGMGTNTTYDVMHP